MPGPRPAQRPRRRVVHAAHGGGRDLLREVVGHHVEPGQQLAGAGSGDREPAQRVAQHHHAGGRLDAVPGDVADAEQDVLRRQDDHVVPVAADQRLGLGGPVPHGDVEARHVERGPGGGMMACWSCSASRLRSAASCSVWASWSRVAASATSVQCCDEMSWYAPRTAVRRPSASTTGSAVTLMCRVTPSGRRSRNATVSGRPWCRTARRNRPMVTASSGCAWDVSSWSDTGPSACDRPYSENSWPFR